MPLTKKQLDELRDGLAKSEASLKDAKTDLAQAKRAGIDVTDQEAQVRELEMSIRKMKAVFG